MNPASASIPAAPPRMVNDIAGPGPAVQAQDSPMPAPAPTLVANIPVHNQAAPAMPANEDAELDKIMHDVGQEMKKEDVKPHKHGFLGLGHKPKPQVNASTQAVRQAPPIPQPISQTQTAAAPPRAQPQPVATPAAAVKPKKQSSTPVFAIFVAVLVTGFLVAAAIAAYKQQ